MKILAIDTSCDETAAAVTQGTTVLSNVVWTQASQHAAFGGVMPSLAQRMHEERIEWVVSEAQKRSGLKAKELNAIAVTAGPGLAIALGVGINFARNLAKSINLPLIPVNHTEGHLLSPLAGPKPKLNFKNIKEQKITFPAFGLVISGGHTELILVKNIGEYQILAKTQDDAIGEALDKAARMLGLGYPGGAVLEKMARLGNFQAYPLPLPMAGREGDHSFSYSGLKTAFYGLVSAQDSALSAQKIYDLAACFQNRAFDHLIRVTRKTLELSGIRPKSLLVGGGVAANNELRRRLKKLCVEIGLDLRLPYSKRLVGDNAAMIGVTASLQIGVRRAILCTQYEDVDRRARWPVDQDYEFVVK